MRKVLSLSRNGNNFVKQDKLHSEIRFLIQKNTTNKLFINKLFINKLFINKLFIKKNIIRTLQQFFRLNV